MESMSIKLEIVDTDKITKILTVINFKTTIKELKSSFNIDTLTTQDFFAIENKYIIGDVINRNEHVRGFSAELLETYNGDCEIAYASIKATIHKSFMNKRERALVAKYNKNGDVPTVLQIQEVETPVTLCSKVTKAVPGTKKLDTNSTLLLSEQKENAREDSNIVETNNKEGKGESIGKTEKTNKRKSIKKESNTSKFKQFKRKEEDEENIFD